MLVAPQAFKSLLPVEDSFSNMEMSKFSRIRHISLQVKHKFVKEENKASFFQRLRRCGSGDE